MAKSAIAKADSEPSCSSEPVTATCQALVVGNYCHDILTLSDGRKRRVLGGSVAYVTRVFRSLGVTCQVVSKVGSDFQCWSEIDAEFAPTEAVGSLTTEFFADWTSEGDRELTAGHVCEAIHASDLPATCRFTIGLAVGVAGEILPETLQKMAQICDHLLVDLQALIRNIDSASGHVTLSPLHFTPFALLLPSIALLKASQFEAQFFDPQECARFCRAVCVTNGRLGSTLYTRNETCEASPFPAEEVDPTGAGDTFLAAFASGICEGLSPIQATRKGNYFGSLAVGQVGVPKISEEHIERWHSLSARMT